MTSISSPTAKLAKVPLAAWTWLVELLTNVVLAVASLLSPGSALWL